MRVYVQIQRIEHNHSGYFSLSPLLEYAKVKLLAAVDRMGFGLQQNFFRYALLGVMCSPSVLWAQMDWMTCPLPESLTNKVERPKDLAPQAVHIEADNAVFQENGVSEMRGAVHISQADKRLLADNATYEQPAGIVTGQGNISFSSDKLTINSQALHYNLPQDVGEMNAAEYQLAKGEGRGKSTKIIQQANGVTQLQNSSYTTCPPGKADWSINASRIDLHHDIQRGTARNVTLKVRNIPLVYLPYMSFPLTKERKSGFLSPVIASNNKSGLQIGLPYYFNLAPNYDLTITPTLLGRRGLQLGSEFRYLTKKHKGSLNYVILPNDRTSDKSNRYYFNIQNDTNLGKESSLSLKAEGVSDSKYFVDLGNSLEATSVVNLERRLEYKTGGKDWSFSTLMQNFQVLDGGTAPHSRLPELDYKYFPRKKGNGVNYEIETNYTNFTDSKTTTNGSRLDLYTRASKKFAKDSLYFKPSLAVRHTDYALNNGENKNLSRTLPTASLDVGAVFERDVRKKTYVQTLEPRLFYTYTPYRDQSKIPIFDSSDRSLSYNQLFAENRFNGRDRIGDENRIAASVTTRIQSPKEGRELFRASIGQTYYFTQPKVTMPGELPTTGDRSEVVMEAAGEINPRTKVSTTAYWDSTKHDFNAGEVLVRYKDNKERILNVGYAQRKEVFESAKASFAVPVKSGWRAVGAIDHDLQNNRNLETVLGAEYANCCWKTRIAARNYLLPDNIKRDNAILLELELKGLGNFGSGTRDLLRNRINGYE